MATNVTPFWRPVLLASGIVLAAASSLQAATPNSSGQAEIAGGRQGGETAQDTD